MQKEYTYIMPSELTENNVRFEKTKMKKKLYEVQKLILDFKFTDDVDAEGIRLIKAFLLIASKTSKKIEIINCCQKVKWKIELITLCKGGGSDAERER